jgi:hypothetical protein
MRAGVVGVFVLALAGCSSPEPSAPALALTGAANLRTAGTTHIEGTGSFVINDAAAMSISFRLSGDAQLPDKSRMRVQISTLGTALNLETISISGKSYVKDAITGKWSEGAGGPAITASVDPFGSVDLSAVRDVTEVDRPIIDGRETRHLRYDTDSTKLLDAMRSGARAASIANPQGSGELWIRVDDSQIVRQKVRVSFQVDALSDLGFSEAGGPDKATLLMSMDMRFSRHGAPVPTITPPPTR